MLCWHCLMNSGPSINQLIKYPWITIILIQKHTYICMLFLVFSKNGLLENDLDCIFNASILKVDFRKTIMLVNKVYYCCILNKYCHEWYCWIIRCLWYAMWGLSLVMTLDDDKVCISFHWHCHYYLQCRWMVDTSSTSASCIPYEYQTRKLTMWCRRNELPGWNPHMRLRMSDCGNEVWQHVML